MEDGNWFLYAAMIVIAFVSWVFNKIQEATAARRRRQDYRDEYREDGGDDFETPRSHSPAGIFEEKEIVEQDEPPPVPVPVEDPMRKLMEALGGTPVKAPTPPPPREIPEPAPEGAPAATPSRPRLSAEERAALERVRKRREAAASGRGARRSGVPAHLSVADLLRDPEGIRKALVLREILDRPRSERPWVN